MTMNNKKKKRTKKLSYAQRFAAMGGKARAKVLSPERLREIGVAAGLASGRARAKKAGKDHLNQ